MSRILPTSVLPTLVWLVLVASGCAHTHHISTDQPESTELLRELEETSARRPATLWSEGERRRAVDLAIALDSITWTPRRDGENTQTLAVAQIQRVQFTHRGQGAIEGLALGALAGVATSFALTLGSGSYDHSVRGVSTIIPASGLVGLVVGLLRGVHSNYVFDPPRRPALLPGPTYALRPDMPRLPPAYAAMDSLLQNYHRAPQPRKAGDRRSLPSARGKDTTSVPATHPPPDDTLRAPNTLDPHAGGWTIIVASYRQHEGAASEATVLREQFEDDDYPTGVMVGTVRGITRYRVAVGQWDTLTQAKTALQQASTPFPPDAWLLRIEPPE